MEVREADVRGGLTTPPSKASRKVAPYITANGEKIWSLHLIEKELHPGRFRRRSGGIAGRRSGLPPASRVTNLSGQ